MPEPRYEEPQPRSTWRDTRKPRSSRLVWIYDTSAHWINVRWLAEGRAEGIARDEFAEYFTLHLEPVPERRRRFVFVEEDA
jgi:hypothetical protein